MRKLIQQVLILAVFVLSSLGVYAQTTVTFDDQGWYQPQDITADLAAGIHGFKFAFTTDNPNSNTNDFSYYFNRGKNSTGAIYTEYTAAGQTITITKADNSDFKFNSFWAQGANDSNVGVKIEGFKNGVSTGSQTIGALILGNPVTTNLNSNFDNVDEVRLTDEGSPNGFDAFFDSFEFSDAISPDDADGDLAAGSGVSEPVGIASTLDTSGEAIDMFDFTLSDGGSGDGLAMTVSEIVVQVSGTSTDAERADVTWRLNGNDASNVTGSYNASANKITFSGLSISIADGSSETYALNAYYNDNSSLIEDRTFILSVDGDTDVTISSGTTMGSTSSVNNGSGSTIDITASKLAFTTQPTTSTSGSALGTQPVVTAQDAFGNTDVDFTETVTLTESSAGSLTNNTQAASNGVATFSGLTYTASADQESFTLTADDEASGSNLSTVDANSVTSDVVATKLVFNTQPAPTTVESGATTDMTTDPVVQAVDANNTVDTGYSTGIALAEVNGAGSATMTVTGDTDGSSSTVTLTPTSGVSTFSNLQLNYTASGSSNETFNLHLVD